MNDIADDLAAIVSNAINYISELEYQRARLIRSLVKYGEHHNTCDSLKRKPCSCGLHAAIKEAGDQSIDLGS